MSEETAIAWFIFVSIVVAYFAIRGTDRHVRKEVAVGLCAAVAFLSSIVITAEAVRVLLA